MGLTTMTSYQVPGDRLGVKDETRYISDLGGIPDLRKLCSSMEGPSNTTSK